MRRLQIMVAVMVAMLAASGPGPLRAQDQRPPYWASISAPEAIMRRGPSRDMRAMWEYRRAGLPLKVLALHEDWRRVQEPDGTTGWMHRSLLTGRRTAIVTADGARIRTRPDGGAPVAYRAGAGVIGRVTDCNSGWCAIDVLGRRGFIATGDIWGDDGD